MKSKVNRMNNSIAKELNNEMVKDIFGKKEAPKSLIKACRNANNHMEELSGVIFRLNMTLDGVNATKGVSDIYISSLSSKVEKLEKRNKALQNKLNIANHKCSAYKSILKDAIS